MNELESKMFCLLIKIMRLVHLKFVHFNEKPSSLSLTFQYLSFRIKSDTKPCFLFRLFCGDLLKKLRQTQRSRHLASFNYLLVVPAQGKLPHR